MVVMLMFSSCADAPLRPVWTPNQNKGKPYPVKKVPVEVWAIGSFKFKGIPGVSKVRLTNAARLAVVICTACSELLMELMRMIAPNPLFSAQCSMAHQLGVGFFPALLLTTSNSW